ncbi:MAG: hypothetical protein IPN79_12175 [Saprospiraceae bacterium]|nr:hypothetical protein [Saprospiraceae bacterium]
MNTVEEPIVEVDRTVQLYNSERPHKSLKYKTPWKLKRNIIFATANPVDDKGVILTKRGDLGASSPHNPEQPSL